MVKHDELGDDETVAMLANDPFHKGLEEHGELPKPFTVEVLSDTSVEESQAKLDRLMKKG